jgi:hypothetical protein
MNILFSQKHKYSVDRSIDEIIEDFAILTKRKWYDFSENITGRLNPDNTFRLTHKWAFGYVSGMPDGSLVYLTGRLKRDGNNTTIETTVRPNFVIVLFLYLIAILFFLELFGVATIIEGPRIFAIFFLPLFWFILLGIILFTTSQLRNRFERLLNLHR